MADALPTELPQRTFTENVLVGFARHYAFGGRPPLPLWRTIPYASSLSIAKPTQYLLLTKYQRAMGIEPTSKAWKAFILPLNYARICYSSAH